MIVLCPKCKTKYRVDENKIGPDGVKLRCSQCQIVFKVAKRTPAQAAPSPQPQARPAPAPVPSPARPAPAPAPAAAPAVTGPMVPQGEVKAELLLADADEIFLNKIGDELVAAGYLVWYARDGETALNFIREKRPKAAILEVMLPGLFGFEVCEKIKEDPELSQLVKLVLIGSVYEKNRFRRAPTTLYGADAYVDKYHNEKEVLKKVEILLGFAVEEPAPEEEPSEATPEIAAAPTPPPPTPPSARPAPAPTLKIQAPPARPAPAAPKPAPPPAPARLAAPAPRVTQPVSPPPAPKAVPRPAIPAPVPPPASPRPVPPPRPAPPAPVKPAAPPAPPLPAPAAPPATGVDWTKLVPDTPEHKKAARLARTIVADIALYNPDLVERGVREGTLFQLLAKDIEDGRKHFQTKAGPEIMAVADYYQLALEDVIAKKKKKLGLE